MKDFVAKISLYDILAMLIPGGTIFLFLSLVLGNQLKINESAIDPILGWTIALVSSYLLGLINHVCTAMIWNPFRNNPIMIQKSYDLVLNRMETTQYLNSFLSKKVDNYTFKEEYMYIWGIVLGYIVVPLVVTICMICSKEYGFIVFTIYSIVIIIYGSIHWFKKNTFKSESFLDVYYSSYYYVSKYGYGNYISIMEGQVAFIQNMFFPLFLIVFFPVGELYWKDLFCCNVCLIKIFISIGILLLFPVVYQRQNKIYQCVWEDFEYLKRLEKQK